MVDPVPAALFEAESKEMFDRMLESSADDIDSYSLLPDDDPELLRSTDPELSR